MTKVGEICAVSKGHRTKFQGRKRLGRWLGQVAGGRELDDVYICSLFKVYSRYLKQGGAACHSCKR